MDLSISRAQIIIFRMPRVKKAKGAATRKSEPAPEPADALRKRYARIDKMTRGARDDIARLSQRKKARRGTVRLAEDAGDLAAKVDGIVQGMRKAQADMLAALRTMVGGAIPEPAFRQHQAMQSRLTELADYVASTLKEVNELTSTVREEMRQHELLLDNARGMIMWAATWSPALLTDNRDGDGRDAMLVDMMGGGGRATQTASSAVRSALDRKVASAVRGTGAE